ncbi:protein of unknown function [Ralstonia solanacearum CMR15]|nr:protein of unknown function [Ralstonia solanacearum CMR15]
MPHAPGAAHNADDGPLFGGRAWPTGPAHPIPFRPPACIGAALDAGQLTRIEAHHHRAHLSH